MRTVFVALLVAGSLALTGCPSNVEPELEATPVPPTSTDTGTRPLPDTMPTMTEAELEAVRRREAQEKLLSQRVIYFDFDKSIVRAEYRQVIAAHARYFQTNGNVRVRLEGHADERGTREYNIGLGERRAQAVRQMLLLGGTSAGQVQTVSYGEERPAVRGEDEAAWSQNRRVEIVYSR